MRVHLGFQNVTVHHGEPENFRVIVFPASTPFVLEFYGSDGNPSCTMDEIKSWIEARDLRAASTEAVESK